MIAKNKKPPSFVRPDLVWVQARHGFVDKSPAPVLFLDRDGVIVEEVNYLHRVEDVRFIDGVAENIAAARRRGWRVAMVTNQAGIGRGYYRWEQFAEVNAFILDWLDGQGALIDVVLAAPYHPEGLAAYRHPDHPMRKPNPGMLLAVADMLKVDLANSVIVGDNVTDLMAGKRAGLGRGVAVLTGHGGSYRTEAVALASDQFAVSILPSAGDAGLQCVLGVQN